MRIIFSADINHSCFNAAIEGRLVVLVTVCHWLDALV